jgi:hypothetical protein
LAGQFLGGFDAVGGDGYMAHFAVDFGGAFTVQVQACAWDSQDVRGAFYLSRSAALNSSAE